MDLPTEESLNIEFFNSKKEIFSPKKLYLFLGLAFLLLVFFYCLFFMAPSKFPKGIIINIEQGENLRGLSFNLKEKNIIRSRVSFEAFVILYGGEKYIALGDYLFENKLPVFEIARRIVQRDRRLASIRITIPEGFDLSQIKEVISSKLKNFNGDNFLLKAREGYLFPDTYFFFSSDSEDDVLESLNKNFEKKIKSIKSEIISSGKTEEEIIIMASLIEREAKGDVDRGYISGILWNRISKKMPLQVDSAMETYKTKGLPQEPICNPGMESMKAALHPVVSEYLYYLHDKNGGIHYAKNFEEHKKNKIKYLK
jgi:UPF0755 protein